jgi:signal transduction histidine kinase
VNRFPRSCHWLRAHPGVCDAGLAAVVLGAVLGSMYAGPHAHSYHPGPVAAALAVLACACLVLRRSRPLTVLAITCAATVADVVAEGGHGRGTVGTSVIVALFTVAARTDRSTTWRVGALTCAGLTVVTVLFGARPWYSGDNFAMFAWTGLAAAAGDSVRSRRAYVTAIEERAERAERTREEEAKRRVTEERMRIARELHDVVAHHIALVNVQAGVAAHIMDTRPDQAKQALAHVREASRSALDELRATVGLLRQSGDPEAPMEPAPGLGVLDQLIDGFRRAGLPVRVAVTGSGPVPGGAAGPGGAAPACRPGGGPGDTAVPDAGPLPAGVDLTAYRVIQESLTNVHKHAGSGARAEVRIARGRDAVEVTVLDDGRGAPAGGPVGHGLIGMRERTAALGGTCEAGPGPDGGFRVHARLPLGASIVPVPAGREAG